MGISVDLPGVPDRGVIDYGQSLDGASGAVDGRAAGDIVGNSVLLSLSKVETRVGGEVLTEASAAFTIMGASVVV